MTERDVSVSVAALALQRSAKLSYAAVRQLLMQLRESPDLAELSIDQVLELAQVTRPEVNMSVSDALRDIEKGIEMGIVPIPISSDSYPPTLRNILDAPPVLYVRGQLSALQSLPGVAVVGTRKATPHGLLIASRISQFLSDAGWPVVSGLAMGIDAAAHEGTMKGKSATVAVLAHGLEKASPTINRPLADRILETGGLWVSEHVVGVSAKPSNFVLRNRIQVGLSCASIIVEGEEKSGSKTQAEFCLQNKRVLFAVLPERGSHVSTLSDLPRMLVGQRGALPLYSRADYPGMLVAVRKKADAMRQES
ncbi:DNA-processing protein DprA [Variovorax paradoxus]|uniref:DNA-processing protein DprA n=1 Tax=Variovorax paradoxus TaxID=34073 RepID=UPI003ECC7D5C